jgi:hypothetical protein
MIIAGAATTDGSGWLVWMIAGAAYADLGWSGWWQWVRTGLPPSAGTPDPPSAWALPAELSRQQPADQRLAGKVRRAAPRLLYLAAVAAFVSVLSVASWLFYVGLFFFVGVILRPGVGPEWQRWVQTGVRRPPVPATWLTPGDLDVVLESADRERHGSAVLEMSSLTGVDPMISQRLIDAAPSTLVQGVSADSADRAREMLERVGGTVTIRPTGAVADRASAS